MQPCRLAAVKADLLQVLSHDQNINEDQIWTDMILTTCTQLFLCCLQEELTANLLDMHFTSPAWFRIIRYNMNIVTFSLIGYCLESDVIAMMMVSLALSLGRAWLIIINNTGNTLLG